MFQNLMNMWATPILTYQYENFNSIKDELVYVIDDLTKKQTERNGTRVATNIKTAGLRSSSFNLFEQDIPVIKKVSNFINNSVLDMLYNRLNGENNYRAPIDPSVEKIEIDTHGWYHNTNNGGQHMAHVHGPSHWSGIFFIQGQDECYYEHDKTNGANIFFNFNNTSADSRSLGNRWLPPSTYANEIVEGGLTIFPGWVPHCATPYYGKKDRIVIAFNVNIEDATEYRSI